MGYETINEVEFYYMEIGKINSSFVAYKYVVFIVRAAQEKSMPATTHPQISNQSMLAVLN